MEYPESFRDFMSGKMTEDEFMNKHIDGKWPEIRKLLENPLIFSHFLLKFRNPGNRRNVLMKSLPIKRDDLEKILQSGSSLVTDLKRPSTRQIRPGVIAKFGIIYRVPYSWASRKFPAEDWDLHNFDHLEDSLIMNSEELINKLSLHSFKEWSIDGYQLKLKGKQSLYLRLERRKDLVIVDLMNPGIDNLDNLLNILNKIKNNWLYQQIPSYIVGHSFYVFFGAKEKSHIEKVVKEEYPIINRLYDLSAIYGGK